MGDPTTVLGDWYATVLFWKPRVAAGLHRHIFNAWTQPADLGWSRHKVFGVEPCLACLYYPDHSRPSEDEQVAASFRQDRLRALSYFATNQPAGLPLRAVSPVADLPAPPEAQDWLTVPLLGDLVATGFVAVEQAVEWADKTIGESYVDGVCGGALLRLGVGEPSEELAVPLAHQSASGQRASCRRTGEPSCGQEADAPDDPAGDSWNQLPTVEIAESVICHRATGK